MPTQFPFTEAKVKAVAPSASGREYHKDTQFPGLQLCVTAAGARTYYFVKRIEGQPTRIRLGTVEQLSVEQARKAAAKKAGAIADGKNPQEQRRQKLHEPTMGDLLAHWKAYAKAHKRSWAEDLRMCDKHFKPWSSRRLSSIRKPEVQAMHLQLAEDSGKYMANRVFELLRAMYNRAKDIGYQGENPALGIKRFSEEKRDRFLHGSELTAFFTALYKEPNTLLQHFFLLCLLTGARRSNVQSMRWDEIDFTTNLWRIAGKNAKAGVPLVIPLTASALSVLQARQEANDTSEWVFPSHGKQGHIVEPKAAWKRIITSAGLVDVRPHDLRRSLGSWMAITGAGLPVVGKMLGHSQPITTAIYARLSVDPVRAAAEAATSAMLIAGGQTKLLEATSTPVTEGSSDAGDEWSV